MRVHELLKVLDNRKLFRPVVNISFEQYDVVENKMSLLTAAAVAPVSDMPKRPDEIHAWLELAFGKNAPIEVESIVYCAQGVFFELNLRYTVKNKVVEVKC